MDKLLKWLSSLPKWLIILFTMVFIGGTGYLMYTAVFGTNDKSDNVSDNTEKSGSVIIGMSDAADMADKTKSRLQSYEQGKYQSANDFWDSLDGEQQESKNGEDSSNDGGLNIGSGRSVPDGNGNAYLDPNEYSEMEMYLIRSGFKTKADIDRDHAESRATRKALEDIRNQSSSISANSPLRNQLTQEQQDSLYYARMERTMEISMKYMNQGNKTETVVEEDPEPEERKIDLTSAGNSSMPTDEMQDDGIISSLSNDGYSGGIIKYKDGKVRVKPCKATFLKTEKISAGQRVIIRLIDDLTLSDGTLLPANTHITGTCSLNKRLNIHVAMLHYGGKMFPTNLDAYDNDGTEGIYCPVIENKAKNSAGHIVQQGMNTAGGIASGLLGTTGGIAGRMLGQVGSAAISEISRSIAKDGTVSINVSSGYEFYIFENLDDDKSNK